MSIPTDRRPIGFWLALVDRLLEESFQGSLGDLTRRHWQVLNVVQQGRASMADIDARLAPFLADGETAASPLAELVQRGWVAGGETFALTESGGQAFQALLDRVSVAREQAMRGIAREDYVTTLATLERGARNLGWLPDADD